jgi:hypothetical protein
MERASGHEFLEHFQSGIVVRNDDDELARGQLILAPGVARTGSYLDVPLAEGMLRMLVIATNEATEDFHRITYEPQEKTAYQGRTTAATPGGKSANVKTQKLVVDPEGANTASQKLAVLRANQNAKTQKLTPTKK